MKKNKDIEYLFEEITFTSDNIIIIAGDFNHFNNFINYYYCSPNSFIYRVYDSYYKWFQTTNKFIPFDIFETIHKKLIIFTKDFNHKYIIGL